MKKKVLIIGPISDFGGREIMTNLLASALKEIYDIKVFSTISMTKNSSALQHISHSQWDTASAILFRNNLVLKLTSLFTKAINKRKEPAHFFIKNRFTKPYFNFNELYKSVIKKEILNCDIVIYSDEIYGKWLSDIVNTSAEKHKKLLLILTGKVREIPEELKQLDLNILAHSKQNFKKFETCSNINKINVDQTTFHEKALLGLDIQSFASITYGYIGRFNDEKGFLELLEAFKINNKKIVFAGNGTHLEALLEACKTHKNITYLGQLNANQLTEFYSQIDVVLIPSFEEGGPIVGVEAMASGKLIISTKVGAMEERLAQTKNDFWFSHEEKSSLPDAINRVEALSIEDRMMIRKEVRDIYIKNNALETIKAKYLQIISNL